MRPVTADEIESLAIGAWILGTGGGGSPYLALLNMRQAYRKGVVCQLMDASELADDDLVAVVSNMGAPLVGQERLTDPKTMATRSSSARSWASMSDTTAPPRYSSRMLSSARYGLPPPPVPRIQAPMARLSISSTPTGRIGRTSSVHPLRSR